MKYIIVFFFVAFIIAGAIIYFDSQKVVISPPSPNPLNPIFPIDGSGGQPTIPPNQTVPSKKLSDNPEVSSMVFQRLRGVWKSYDFEGNLLAVTNDDWQVEYEHRYRTLLVRVSGYPGLEHQKAAEQALIDGLGMKPEEICELGVEVWWDNYDTQFDPVRKQLTFCE